MNKHDFYFTSYLEPGMVRIQFHYQKEHHNKVSFEEEYRQFLIEKYIEIDERYFLKD
jgi:hypothetical protein